MPARNPRIMITMPEGLMRAIEVWADKEGSKPATLATSLLMSAVRDAIKSGVIPSDAMDVRVRRDESAIAPDTKNDLEEFLKLLAAGDCPDDGKLILLAHALDIDAEILIDLCNQVDREGSTNGV